MNDQQLEAAIQLITKRIAKGHYDKTPFKMNGGKMLTIKRTNGNYAKGVIPDGTEMRLTAAYVGKRGTPIFVFKPSIPMIASGVGKREDIKFVEMGLNEVSEHLRGFGPAWVEVVGNPELAVLSDDAIYERAQKERIEEHPNDLFGSW